MVAIDDHQRRRRKLVKKTAIGLREPHQILLGDSALVSDHLNFVDDDGDCALLLRRITEMRGPRAFFSRGE